MSASWRRLLFVLILAAVSGTWWVTASRSNAGPRASAAGSRYQYVGVQQSIARIDLQTGGIEVLTREGETRASLLIPSGRAWSWRRVRIVRAGDGRSIARPVPPDETAPLEP
ncbi:MAG: hypothetical protein ACE5F9_07935 [Phycisphaerae bacterium]